MLMKARQQREAASAGRLDVKKERLQGEPHVPPPPRSACGQGFWVGWRGEDHSDLLGRVLARPTDSSSTSQNRLFNQHWERERRRETEDRGRLRRRHRRRSCISPSLKRKVHQKERKKQRRRSRKNLHLRCCRRRLMKSAATRPPARTTVKADWR